VHRNILLSPSTHRAARRGQAHRRLKLPAALVGLALVLAGCVQSGSADSSLPDLPSTTAEEFSALLATLDKPAVVNVWASWCLPCRAEAPLFARAHAQHGENIEFIGVDVQDSQAGAKGFLTEFDLDFDHFFDPDREVPNAYGGFGTPITLFFGPGGELVSLHNGVVDERTLALNIDELSRLGS
jgi:cytochrome c biogenesis protein CcmG/thiol:disulfide interchange protein DsbE